MLVVVVVVLRSWKYSWVRGLELSVRDIPPLAVNPSVQASTLSQDLSMRYAVVAIRPGDVDQLP